MVFLVMALQHFRSIAERHGLEPHSLHGLDSNCPILATKILPSILRYGGLYTVYTTVVGYGVGTAIATSASVFLLFDKAAGPGRQFWVLEVLLAIMLEAVSKLTQVR